MTQTLASRSLSLLCLSLSLTLALALFVYLRLRLFVFLCLSLIFDSVTQRSTPVTRHGVKIFDAHRGAQRGSSVCASLDRR